MTAALADNAPAHRPGFGAAPLFFILLAMGAVGLLAHHVGGGLDNALQEYSVQLVQKDALTIQQTVTATGGQGPVRFVPDNRGQSVAVSWSRVPSTVAAYQTKVGPNVCRELNQSAGAAPSGWSVRCIPGVGPAAINWARIQPNR